jgi:transcription initiation factor TFIIH subunit 4
MLEDLRDYGLVWQKKASSKRFSPTRLATTLTSLSPPLPTSSTSGTIRASSGTSVALTTGAGQQGFIVLETNYRIYAYTDNPLEIAVLNLFITMKYRFPNLVVGMLTRESVRKALSNGISADQIISYLTTHAHPQMRKNVRRSLTASPQEAPHSRTSLCAESAPPRDCTRPNPVMGTGKKPS